MIRTVAATIVGAAAYGFTIGYAHSDLYASRDLVKVPLLLTTAVVCGLGYFVTGLAWVEGLRFRDTTELAFSWFKDLSILLASLAPPNLLIAWTLRSNTTAEVGDYPLFLLANLVFIGIAGTVSLIRQARSILERHRTTRNRACGLVGTWLLLALIVGGQGSFFMRPFFGLPASRGRIPPFFLGNEADVRRAGNFFEVVLQFGTNPELPDGFRTTDR